MKKILMSLVIAAFGTVFVASPTFAQSVQQNQTCTITNTGAGSNNTCTVDTNNVVKITCINSATLTNVNTQNAQSGSVSVNGNTISGTALSGSVSNINDLANDLSVGCGTSTPVTPTPTTPTAATPAAGRGAEAAKVASLPATGATTPLEYALGGIAALSAVAIVAVAVRRALTA